MDLDRRMFDLAGAQHGLITRRQLLEIGFSPSAISRRQRARLLRVRGGGVYAVAGAIDTYEQRVLAPLLATRHLAAASHATAARLIGLRGYEKHRQVHVTVRRPGDPRRSRATVHRSFTFDKIDIENASGLIPVTRAERTVIGCAELRAGAAGAAIDAAILGGRTTYDRLWRYLTRYGGPGCPGSGPVKRALIERDPRERPAESDLERVWIDALAAQGIVGLVKQLPVRTEDGVLRIDLAHPVLPVGIEFDSRLWHSSEADYRRERRKRYLLARAGYRILPVTEFDLHERAGEIASDLLSIFGRSLVA